MLKEVKALVLVNRWKNIRGHVEVQELTKEEYSRTITFYFHKNIFNFQIVVGLNMVICQIFMGTIIFCC